MGAVTDRLRELGVELPAVAAPVAAYVPTVRVGDQVWTSGQLPFVDGSLPATGKVGGEISAADGEGYARTAALNALAAIDAQVGIDNVARVLKVVVFVASETDFHGQPQVANGASNLLVALYGDHIDAPARSAIGLNVLPGNIPVEIEAIFKVKQD